MAAPNLSPVAYSSSLIFNPLNLNPLNAPQRNVIFAALAALACVGACFCTPLALSAWGASKIITALVLSNSCCGLAIYVALVVQKLHKSWRVNRIWGSWGMDWRLQYTPPARGFVTSSLIALGVMAVVGPLGYHVNKWNFRRQLEQDTVAIAPSVLATLFAVGTPFGYWMNPTYVENRLIANRESVTRAELQEWEHSFPGLFRSILNPECLPEAGQFFHKEVVLNYYLERLAPLEKTQYVSSALAAVNNKIARAFLPMEERRLKVELAPLCQLLERAGGTLDEAYGSLLRRAEAEGIPPLKLAIQKEGGERRSVGEAPGDMGFFVYLLGRNIPFSEWQEASQTLIVMVKENENDSSDDRLDNLVPLITMSRRMIAYACSSRECNLEGPSFIEPVKELIQFVREYADRRGLYDVEDLANFN